MSVIKVFNPTTETWEVVGVGARGHQGPQGPQGPEGPQGDSSFEVTQARVDASGQTNATLKARLDKEHNEVTTQLTQIENERLQSDFVEELKGINHYDEIKVRKNSDGTFDVSLSGPENMQRMNFMAPDDYFKLSDVHISRADFVQTEDNVQYSDLNLTGSWHEGLPNHIKYAKEVGAFAEYTFTISGEGSMSVTHYVEDRGGLMQATINGENAVTYSTYGNSEGNRTVSLYNNIPSGTHTLKLEFIGDDPDNPPSSGTGTSRGWANSNQSLSGDPRYVLNINDIGTKWSDEVLTMSESSNKEFAFQISTPNSEGSDWVPFHNRRTAFNKSPITLILDGVSRSLNSLNIDEEYSCKKLQIKQDIYGRYYGSGDTNLINIKTVHTITLDGNISIKGNMETLEDINIYTSYVVMAPVNNKVFDVLQSSLGEKYPATKSDYSSTHIDVFPRSYVFLSSESDCFVAFRHTDQRANMDLNGSAVKKYSNFLEHRDETLLKHYINIFDNQTLPKGYVFNWSGDYITGYVI